MNLNKAAILAVARRDLKAYWVDPRQRERVIGRAKQAGIIENIEVQRRRSDGSLCLTGIADCGIVGQHVNRLLELWWPSVNG